MKDLKNLLVRAGENPKFLKVLNPALRRMIPFNSPHKFSITELTAEKAVIRIPWKRNNLNHLKGIHALALTTASEYCSGLLILRLLGTKDYRLIMRSIKTDYHYQAKTAIDAVFELSNSDLNSKILSKIEDDGLVDFVCDIKTFDIDKNHVSTTTCDWQIKKWDKVKTKV